MRPTYDRQSTRYLHTGSKQWRAIRKAQLELYPLCADCGDAANEVDHLRDTSDNVIGVDLASMCKPCHSRRTAARERGIVPRIVGCDVDGWPLDPNHPWNNEKSPEG